MKYFKILNVFLIHVRMNLIQKLKISLIIFTQQLRTSILSVKDPQNNYESHVFYKDPLLPGTYLIFLLIYFQNCLSFSSLEIKKRKKN